MLGRENLRKIIQEAIEVFSKIVEAILKIIKKVTLVYRMKVLKKCSRLRIKIFVAEEIY